MGGLWHFYFIMNVLTLPIVSAVECSEDDRNPLEDVEPVVTDTSSSRKDQAYEGERRRVTCNNPLFFCEPSDGHGGSSAAGQGKGEHNSSRCNSGELRAHDVHQQCNMAKVGGRGLGK